MKYTFKQFQAEYPDDSACLDKIMQEQYGGIEFVCPSCKVLSKFHQMTKRRGYACDRCGHHIYPCVGTIFEKSRTKLTHWFFAMYLMTSTRHGVAAKELERQIGCTYKTAWRIAHELRKLMAQADNHRPLKGHIEVDETSIGGLQSREVTRLRGSNKTIVFGLKERDGILRSGPIKDVKRSTTLTRIFAIMLNLEAPSALMNGQDIMTLKTAYDLGRVNHNSKQYVNGIFIMLIALKVIGAF